MIAKVILIALSFGSLILNASKHGKKRSRYNGPHAFVSWIIVMILYYFAGVFEGIL